MGAKPTSGIGTWAMTALVVGVVAALLLLVWQLRQTQGPTASTADKPPPVHQAMAPLMRHESRPAKPRGERAGDDEPGAAVAEDVASAEPSVDVTTPIAELLARSSGELRKAAATCLDGREVTADRTQKTEFDFVVVFKGGEATVEELVPVASDLEDKALERCIHTKVSNARWKTPQSRTFRKRWRQSISLADLSR